jgi:hypothetical protein
LTVSFNVLVPNSALAAARAFSSMSTKRLAMSQSISRSLGVYPSVSGGLPRFPTLPWRQRQ